MLPERYVSGNILSAIFFFVNVDMRILCLIVISSVVLYCQADDSPASSALDIVDLGWTPKSVFVCMQLTIVCKTSLPDADVWFTLNGLNTSQSTSQPLLAARQETDETEWSLVIACPQVEDSGNYACHAVLPRQPDTYTQRNATITILSFSVIKLVATPIVLVELTRKVEIICDIYSHKNSSWPFLPNAHWSRNGQKVPFNKDGLNMIDSGHYRMLVVISVFEHRHVGLYKCTVPFLIGEASAMTYVTVPEMFITSKPSVQLLSNKSDALLTWVPPLLPSAVSGRNISFHYHINFRSADRTEARRISVSPMGAFLENRQAYIWRNLSVGHFYRFEVATCLENGKCGKLSDPSYLTHFESICCANWRLCFAHPQNVSIVCHYDNVSHSSIVDVSWHPPETSEDVPLTYRIEVLGSSVFHDPSGGFQLDKESHPYFSQKTFWRQLVKPNTNYSVQVCVTTTYGCGNHSLSTEATSCSTPPSVPSELPLFRLQNGDSSSDYLRLDLQRITERDGPIRCYRVVLYKMRPGQLSPPNSASTQILSYDLVYEEGGYGAYVAEAFDRRNFKQVVVLGDETQSDCETAADNDDADRQKREVASEGAQNAPFWISDDTSEPVVDVNLMAYDGKLDSDTKYSGFIEVVVIGLHGMELKRRSRMFPVIRTHSNSGFASMALPTALGVICGLFGVILILTVALCVLRRKGMVHKSAASRVPVVHLPSTKPIRKESLVSAYIERHKDSDLLFQREYELLPEYFKDRTSKSSDSVENFYKNRYPDIKAYDQTRVKLSVVNGSPSSDYINANNVQGYRSNKKFICAQGPLDKTVNDFWKMIWEQKVEIIAMVTGLEENGKTKCVKYWPDEGEACYEDLCVSTVSEVVCGEYAVRRFTLSSGAAAEIAPEQQSVVQFHYLAWRDFLAPDHPAGILKFIKRLREVHNEKNYRGHMLVHCSAGVGRTGTLVAIDSLLDQMEEEGQVDVFSLVADLRRYRNFLVQSLTQYIFIYRALAEYAQFGDTEIATEDFAATLERFVAPSVGGKLLIQAEFEKLDEVLDDYKTTDVGTMDVNVNKNRYDFIVPFDKNRVVLTALSSAPSSTYINASIIQGYDRSAAYIITQDPFGDTISSFWRMVHEHCVPIVVMLSEFGDEQDKCTKYWPDVEAEHDHIHVLFKDGEEVDGATVRHFLVTNKKTSSPHALLHVQFKEWGSDPVASSSTASLLRLVERVHGLQVGETSRDPIVVHCSGGGDRSSQFVALSILVRQAVAEKRVDVFHVVSNLKSQRKFMINDMKQYRFCYEAIGEFILTRDLHR